MEGEDTEKVVEEKHEESDEEEEEEEKKEKKGGICKAVIRFLASVGGLFIVLTAYIVGGAYAFIYFESKLEEEERLNKLAMEERLNNSEAFMVNYFTSLHYDPPVRLDNCSYLYWRSEQYADYHSFSSSCAASEYFTEFCTCVRAVRELYQEEVSSNMYKLAQFLVKMSDEHGFDGRMGVFEPKWTLPNAILFTMSTLTMIGYGHIAPRTFAGQNFCMAYSVIGLALMMLFLANIGNLMADGIKTAYSRLACRWCRVRRRWTEHSEKANNPPDKIRDDLVGPEDYMPTDDIAVPITVTIMFMGLYIFGGAAVFCKWEGWDLISSVYFTWVTLTTIGFGDMTPGSSFHGEMDLMQVAKMTFTSVYLLLGLALISMGISLSSEQVKNKAVWFAYAVGFKENEEVVMRRNRLTRCTDVKETPKDKTGNKQDFFGVTKPGRGDLGVYDVE